MLFRDDPDLIGGAKAIAAYWGCTIPAAYKRLKRGCPGGYRDSANWYLRISVYEAARQRIGRAA